MRKWLEEKEEPQVEVPEQEENVEFITVTEMRPREEALANQGYAFIKRVARGKDNKEVVRIEVIPITTARLEATRQMIENTQRPTPPYDTKLYGPEHEYGRAMGLTRPTPVQVAKVDDPEYIKRLEKYQEFAMWSIAAEAIDMPLYFRPSAGEEVKPAETTADKVHALKQAGYQGVHIQEIMAAAVRISNFTDVERRDFFGAA